MLSSRTKPMPRKLKPDRALAARAQALMNAVHEVRGGVDNEFRLNLGRDALALTASVPADDTVSWVPTVPTNAGQPDVHGPSVNYALGCYFATDAAARDESLAVRHFLRARVDPEADSWRERDPQLSRFIVTGQYRKTFGKNLPKDLLAVAPFSDYATQLRAPPGLSPLNGSPKPG